MDDFQQLRSEIEQAIGAAGDLAALDQVRVGAVGKKGSVSALMSRLGSLQGDEKRAWGAAVNQLKDEVTAALDVRREELAKSELAKKLETERLDLTLPAEIERAGKIHPISQTIDEVIAIFGEMGFVLAEGPDIEDDFHNFTALNFPPGHPAREMHDTFYLPTKPDGSRLLLRTHTSPVQVRTMQATKPPIRIIAPGRLGR